MQHKLYFNPGISNKNQHRNTKRIQQEHKELLHSTMRSFVETLLQLGLANTTPTANAFPVQLLNCLTSYHLYL